MPEPSPARDCSFDGQAYRALEEALGTDALASVVAGLETQIVERLSRLDQPPATLSAAAHELLNAAGMLGFTGFAAACRALHEAVRRGDDLRDILVELEASRDETLALMAQLRRETSV